MAVDHVGRDRHGRWVVHDEDARGAQLARHFPQHGAVGEGGEPALQQRSGEVQHVQLGAGPIREPGVGD